MPGDCASIKLGVALTQICSYSYPTIYVAHFIEHSVEVTLN